MEGLNQDVLAFLIDIQEHGANQLRALSADFKALGATADQIGGRLKVLEAQLAKTATGTQAASAKVTDAAKAQTAATGEQVAAAGKLTAAQRTQASEAGQVAGATDKLTAAQRAQAGEARAAAGATAQSSAANAGAAASAAGAAAQLRGHTSAISEHQKRLEKLKSTSSQVAHTMNAVSLPLLATGAISIKMGVDFEAAMSRLHTQAGYATSDVKALEAAVLKAAPAMRRTPTELAEGLYHVASVGIPARDALKVMESAAIGANVGASSLDDTTNGLVIVMKSLKQGASSAREDMALLNEIIGGGNLHMQDLVGSLGKVLPQAQNFGLGLRDVGASLDVLTARGMDANMAATRLAMSFNLLGAPKPAAQKALAEIGIGANQLGEDIRKPDGVLVAVQDLSSHLDKAFPRGRKLSLEDERKALSVYKATLEAAGVSGKTLTTDLEKFANKLAQTKNPLTAQAAILSAAFGGGRQSGAILSLVQNVDDLRKAYGRLPEGEKALKTLEDAQKQWEKTSAAQFDALKSQAATAATSLGKNLAPIAIGVLKDIAGGAEAVKHVFDELPAPVQKLVEGFVALMAVAGPLAGLVSKFASAALLIEKFRRGGGGIPGGVPIGTSGPGGVAGTVLKAEQQLTGLRGVGVGSRVNPVVVAVLGQVPGGGAGFQPIGQKSASEAEKAATEAERKGGVLLPTAAEDLGVAAAGAPAAASLGSKVLGVGKDVLGRAGGAAMIGLGGLAVSEIAGGLIGGKAGDTVSGIGKDAAFGAALGSMIEPGLGTAVGAALGAGFAGLKDLGVFGGPSHAQATGEAAASGGPHGPHFDSTTTKFVQQAVQRNQEALDKRISEIEAGAATAHPQAKVGRSDKPALYAPERHEVARARQEGNFFEGQQAGAAQAKYTLAGVKFPDLDSIIRVARAKMGELAPVARVGYAGMIRAGVEALEREKRLPEHAIDKLNKDIADRFGSLSKESFLAGSLSMKALKDGLKSDAALGTAKSLVEQLRKVWSGIPQAANVTGQNAVSFFEKTGARLKQVIASTSGEQKKEAEKAYKELQASSAGYFGGMVHEAEANLEALEHHTGPLSKQSTEAVEHNFEQMRKQVELEVKLGVLSPKQGLEALAKVTPPLALAATNPVSKAYANMRAHVEGAMAGTESATSKGLDNVAKKAQAALSKFMGQNAATNFGNTNPVPGKGGAFGPGVAAPAGAKGMRVPGPVGPDNVPIHSPAGQLRGIVAGGELLIANRHTEHRVNRMLSHFGTSLGHEVAGEKRPHDAPVKRFATGGRAPEGYVFPFPKGEGFSWNRVDQGQDMQGPPGGPVLAIGPGNVSIGHDRFGGFGPFYPLLSLSAGPWKGRQVYYGHTKDTRTGSVRAGDVIGVTQDKANTWTAAPAGWLEFGFTPYGSMTAGQAVAPMLHALAVGHMVAGAGGGGVAPSIKAPKWTGPAGLLGRIGRAVLAKATAAANAKLASSGGAPGGGGITLLPGAGGTPVGASVFGGPGDPGTGSTGYKGDNLNAKPDSYAELDMGHALGGLPYMTKLRITNPATKRSAIAFKRDIGAGGGPVGGLHRAIDLWFQLASSLGVNGLAPVDVQRATHGAKFAGAFGQGGVVTADKPTLALFGEKGRETATFTPGGASLVKHATTGAEIGAGIIPAGGGEKKTEGLNPDNNQIEEHTAAEWRSIRTHHAQYVKDHPKAKGPTGTRSEPIGFGRGLGQPGISVDLPVKEAGPIDLSKGLDKLSSSAWKKVMAAIEAALKQTGKGSTFATQVTDDVTRVARGKRGKELAQKAIEDTSKTIMTVFSKSPRNEEAAGSTAIGNLEHLIADANRIHAKALVTQLAKNIETVLTSAGAAIVKATEAPKAAVGGVDATAIGRLGALVDKARKRGSTEVELTLRKDIEQTIGSWSSSISTILQRAQQVATRGAQLGIAQRNLAIVKAPPTRTTGPGAALRTNPAADPNYVASQSAALQRSIGEYQREQGAIVKLIAHELGQGAKQLTTVVAHLKKAAKRPGGLGKGAQVDAAAIGRMAGQINAQLASYKAGEQTIANLVKHERDLLHKAQGQLHKLTVKLHNAVKHHHSKVAAQLRREIGAVNAAISAIDAVLGEAAEQVENVAGAIQEAQTNEAELAAEHLKAVYEEWVEQIHQTAEQFEAIRSRSQTAEKIEEGNRHLTGTDFTSLEEKKGEQEGILSSAQIAQAQADLAAYTSRHQEQIASDEAQKAYEESVVGGLSGSERTAMERSIEELGLNIVELKDQIYDQTKATAKLTEATNTAAKAYGGSVGFSYNGQEYAVGGQSSVSAPDIMVGT